MGMCSWCCAMDKYERVVKVVEPKRRALAIAEAKLKVTMDALDVKKAALKKVVDELAELQGKLDAANAKEAEVVIGGALDGPNEVSYKVKKLKGGTGKEVMTIRVYLMPEAADAKPIKAFEYQIAAKEVPKSDGTATFIVDSSMAEKLSTR